ncbi:MAG: DnaB-like helicase N-terminal domain-containing protein [Mycobacteriales bacterium]|nr:DnaB-like helicase N-terminal domain-containing protein [Mycobacteriales bacterium]
MEHFRAAERALVSALVLGNADRLELSGRLRESDFTDPAAAVLFRVAMDAERPIAAADLPAALQRQGLLRRDGYPLSELLDWLPRLPVPVHPEAWATLIVAGTVGRQVNAAGVRLLQAVDIGREGTWPVGKVLAMASAQRASLASGFHRWEDLPAKWRDTMPCLPVPDSAAAERSVPEHVAEVSEAELARGAGRERVLLAGLVAAPQLLGRIPWLRDEDFTDPACGSVFEAVRRVHERGGAVDVVTLPALCDGSQRGWSGQSPSEVARALRPDAAVPTTVPFLSRMVLGDALLRGVERAGRELVALAEAPASAGGVGSGLMTAAQTRLEVLRPFATRWEEATRPSRMIDLTRHPGLERTRALERSTPLERSATSDRFMTADLRSGLNRDAG